MRAPYGDPDATLREIGCQFRQGPNGTDKIVSRKFGAVAKVLWPTKTAAYIAALAGRDERTAARWLSGEFEPPIIVVLAVVQEIFRQQ